MKLTHLLAGVAAAAMLGGAASAQYTHVTEYGPSAATTQTKHAYAALFHCFRA